MDEEEFDDISQAELDAIYEESWQGDAVSDIDSLIDEYNSAD